ncbi:hypothetical protein OB236_24940 [Paenibacillus sp. WQ 127069]|uniref:Uncharacterized protein n=1 Tax=Paenibacillus baimaensis TaxID=2982185 RepID=A0ABT2UL45_9BACL|nr:hypothetical protein [Paenibacillus sp. WQ 127069]
MNQVDQPWVYIVLFGLVFIIYAKIIPRTSATKGQANPTLHEIEEAMEHFTAELDEQNKALIQLLAETKRDYEVQTAKLTSRLEIVEKQSALTNQELNKLGFAYEELQKKAAHQPEKVPVVELQNTRVEEKIVDVEDLPVAMNLKSRYEELFSLFEQGKSVEYIAKKLNMNKGEINLIFQLAKQEEKLNAH